MRRSSYATGGSVRDSCATCEKLTLYDWFHQLSRGSLSTSFSIVEVLFKARRTEFFYNSARLDLRPGDTVIIEADRGVDIGTVYLVGDLVRARLASVGLPKNMTFSNIIRRATSSDIETARSVHMTEAKASEVAAVFIRDLSLDMKVVEVEWQLDRNKLTFYFTADHRVDFRTLVRKLAGRFRTRVELRQIGARDQAARRAESVAVDVSCAVRPGFPSLNRLQPNRPKIKTCP